MSKIILISVVISFSGEGLNQTKTEKEMDSLLDCQYLKHSYEINPPFEPNAVVQGFYCEVR